VARPNHRVIDQGSVEVYTSFSKASAKFRASLAPDKQSGLARAGFAKAKPDLACHHEAGTYQIPHSEPYIPRPALNFPLFLGSLAVAPILGLLLVLGSEAECASGLQSASGTSMSPNTTLCPNCRAIQTRQLAARLTIAQTQPTATSGKAAMQQTTLAIR
jgi:hypothetical protein